MQSKTTPLHSVQPKQAQILNTHALVIFSAKFIDNSIIAEPPEQIAG